MWLGNKKNPFLCVAVVPSLASGHLLSPMPPVAFDPSGAVASGCWLAVLLIRSLGRGRTQLRSL